MSNCVYNSNTNIKRRLTCKEKLMDWLKGLYHSFIKYRNKNVSKFQGQILISHKN